MGPILPNGVSVALFAPELVLSVGVLAVLLVDLIVPKSSSRVAVISGTALLFVAAACGATWWLAGHPVLVRDLALTAVDRPVAIFNGLLVLDAWALFFKGLSCAAAGLSILIAAPSAEIPRARLAEYLALLLTITVGLCLMASASDLLTAILSVELVSVVSYALAGFKKGHRQSAEAALKYVIYGSVASGLMIFGTSWLYGMWGTTSLLGAPAHLSEFLGRGGETGKIAVIVAVVLVLCGLGFKVAAVPWHMWCPDVYEGAPTPFTAFLSVAPKAAGFALMVRFLSVVSGAGIPWEPLLGVLAAITMTAGNVAALAQTNLKRLLAYSSIAHAGYLLMGLAAGSATGTEAVALYLVLYLFMNLGAFLAVGVVSRLSGSEVMYEFRGLSARAPFTAIAMALFLFSLTGLPPLAGFIGKFHLFRALLEGGTPWKVGLALVGLFNSVLSLYYYARVVKAMFLDKPGSGARLEVPATWNFLLGFFALGVVVFGLSFEGLRQLARAAVGFYGVG